MFKLRISAGLLLCAGLLSAQLPAKYTWKKTETIATESPSNPVHFKDYYRSIKDDNTGKVHSVWTEFEYHLSSNPSDSSFIMYSRLDNSSVAWTPPLKLNNYRGGCMDDDATLVSNGLCKGTEGELYVAWGGPAGLSFQRSLDGGLTWLPTETIIGKSNRKWHLNVTDTFTFKGAPSIACVESPLNKGRVYITWSDARNGEHNDDVFMIYSDDKGSSWTDAVILTYRPNHRQQFYPQLRVDPRNGYLYVLYYDRQNFPFGGFTDLYLAVSKNEGVKFDYYRVNDQPIPLSPGADIQSSVHLSEGKRTQPASARSRHLGATVAWHYRTGDIRNTYIVLLNDSILSDYDRKYPAGEVEIARSFTYAGKMSLKFYSPKEQVMSAVLTKPLEHGWEKVLAKDMLIKKGYNTIEIDAAEHGLVKGNYVLTLYYDHRNTYVWITEE